ncbi:MAG TPA: hypothetical protein ENJ45_01835 [Phaeodactylibacter sp.]|nr:hypothetical protein [Phaeodactylibacter sp.]
MTNSYIEIPRSGYGKFGKIEVFGGPYIAFLVASKAVGDYQFNSSLVELKADLNYNYFKDDIIDPSALDLNEEDYELFNINGQPVFYPEVATAYYDFQKKDGKFFNGIDYGLNAGIALYLNDGLYISANLNYGLADLSNDAFDHAYSRLSEDMRAYLPRKDVDKNFTIQASVGFAF